MLLFIKNAPQETAETLLALICPRQVLQGTASQIPSAPGAAPRLVELATAAARAIDREPVNEVI